MVVVVSDSVVSDSQTLDLASKCVKEFVAKVLELWSCKSFGKNERGGSIVIQNVGALRYSNIE